MITTQIHQWLQANEAHFTQMADDIWARPEVKFEEYYASKLQADYLEEAGFKITWDLGQMSTAFVAEWGAGEPVIGFVGEYDALPGLSQMVSGTPNPVEEDGHGHGCGHNLLGTGCLAAAVALKQWLQTTEKPGTIRYYGCPAEEGGSGKVFMAREGCFDDLSAAFNYHPGYFNYAAKSSTFGVNHIRFRFHGRSAHAAAMPHMGRSALDAVELMNVGVNFLREHVEDNVRIHYVITNGGLAPNIVPDKAEVYYYVRAHLPEQVEAVTERVRKCAAGAAMMTETRLEEIYDSGSTCMLNNYVMADLQTAVMNDLGPIHFTEEELTFAAEINSNNPPGNQKMMETLFNLDAEVANQPLIGDHFANVDEGKLFPASTDVGDVSWKTPLSLLNTTCWPTNAAAHSWGVVATGGMSIGHKGMMYAAQVMANAAAHLIENPDLITEARAEFDGKTAATPYISPVPADVFPPQNPNPYRK